jgi:hypothetical protein
LGDERGKWNAERWKEEGGRGKGEVTAARLLLFEKMLYGMGVEQAMIPAGEDALQRPRG